MPVMSFLIAGTVQRCGHRGVRERSFPVFGRLFGEVFQRAVRGVDCGCCGSSPRQRPRKQQVCVSNVALSTYLAPVVGCRTGEPHERKTLACLKLWLLDQVPGGVVAL